MLIVWDICIRVVKRCSILYVCKWVMLLTPVLIFGIIGVIWGVTLILLHKNTWKCSRGLMENLLTGRKQKLLENWMKCL